MIDNTMDTFFGMFSSFSQGDSIVFTFKNKKDFIEREFSLNLIKTNVLISSSQLVFEYTNSLKFHNYLFLAMNVFNALDGDIYSALEHMFFIDLRVIPKLLVFLGTRFYFSIFIKKKNSKIFITDENFATAVYTIKAKHNFSVFMKKIFNPEASIIEGLPRECIICLKTTNSTISNSCRHYYCTQCFVDGIINEINFCFYCKKPY